MKLSLLNIPPKLYPSRQLDELKPILNRLSRARRIVKNVFGIVCERFAILQKPIALDIGKVKVIVLAACAFTCRQAVLIRRICNTSVGDWRSGPSPQGKFISL